LIHLIRLFSLRHFYLQKWNTALTLVGIALGVAVFVSIRISINSALGAFESTIDHVAGRTTLEITSPGSGFDENLFPLVANTKGVEAATPIVQSVVECAQHGHEPLLVLGIDIFSDQRFRSYRFGRDGEEDDLLRFLLEPRAIAVTRTFARRLGLALGSRLDLLIGAERVSFTIRGIMDEQGPARALGGNFALVDIAHAQETFGRVGLLDRIDLIVMPQVSPEAVARRLREKLPGHLLVRRPRTRNKQVENMIGAFRLNLTALSFIALFVGMFLIYNSMSISVIRRRREIGIIRSLGLSRNTVLALFLLEGAILGFLGAVLGIGVGLIMAKFTLASVSKTVTALYILVKAEHLSVSASTLILGVLISVAVSIISAAGPALEASRTTPRSALLPLGLDRKVAFHTGRLLYGGLGALALAGLFAIQKPVFGRPLFGFAAAFLILAGFSLIIPAGVGRLTTLFTPLIQRLWGTEGRMAGRYFRDSLTRTTITIAALMTALAMLISISLMILSFRKTVDAWVGQAITADLILSPAGAAVSAWEFFLPPPVLAYARKHPDVKAVDMIHVTEMEYRRRPVLLWAAVTPVLLGQSQIRFVRGDRQKIIQSVTHRGRIIISETFSSKFGFKEGQDLMLQTPQGPKLFRIAGIFYDYTTENGMIIIDLDLYQRIWKDTRINRAALFLKDPSSITRVRKEILRRFSGRYQVLAVSNRQLRTRILSIFDQTFSIAHALKVIAFVVAALGIINSMQALVLERERDLGILRAVGTSRRQIRKMTLLEAQLMGMTGFLFGAPTGVLLSLVLIYVINKQSFGWTIRFSPVPSVFVQSLVLVVLAAFMAGLIPARWATRKRVSDAVKLE